MKWFNFDNIKNSSFHITPNFPIITTKRYKFSILRVAAYLGIYTIVAWFVLIIILTITPLKDYVFVINNSDLKAQTEKIKELQNKVVVLTDQLQELASTNERMRYAMKLAGRDSIKPNDALYDTLRKKIDKKINVGGNIYEVFVSFVEKYFGVKNNLQTLFFIEPTNGVITQGFNSTNGHMGVDFGVASGTPVYALQEGYVVFNGTKGGYGEVVTIKHQYSDIPELPIIETMYAHNSKILVNVGQYVKRGDVIALIGSTGRSTGPHLHFEVHYSGGYVNPVDYLTKLPKYLNYVAYKRSKYYAYRANNPPNLKPAITAQQTSNYIMIED